MGDDETKRNNVASSEKIFHQLSQYLEDGTVDQDWKRDSINKNSNQDHNRVSEKDGKDSAFREAALQVQDPGLSVFLNGFANPRLVDVSRVNIFRQGLEFYSQSRLGQIRDVERNSSSDGISYFQDSKKNSSKIVKKKSIFYRPISGLVAASLLLAVSLVLVFRPASSPDQKQQIISLNNARAIFVAGKVKVREVFPRSDWRKLRIGEKLQSGMAIRTEDNGRCDIQIGEDSVFRMKENSEIHLNELFRNIASGKSKTELELVIGKVLLKPKELSDGESFQVNTPTAVAGVRGTKFSVESTPGKDTRIAVLSGKVTLRKRIKSLEKADRKIIESSHILSEVDKSLKNTQVMVTANETVEVKAKEVEKVNRDLEQVIELVKGARERRDKKIENIDDFLGKKISAKDLQDSDNKVAVFDNKESLQGQDKKDLLEFSRSLDTLGEIRNSAKLQVRVLEPEDAEIFLSDQLLGKGSAERIVKAGEALTVIVKREGYVSKAVPLRFKSGESRSISVSLRPLTKKGPALIWEKKLDKPLLGQPYYSQGKLFIVSGDGKILALNRQGKEMWNFNSGESFQSSPLVVRNMVFISSTRGNLFALDADSGKQIWKRKLGAIVYGNRVAVQDHNLIFGTANGSLVSLALDNGRINWVFRAASGIFSTPLVKDGKIFFGSEDSNVYAVSVVNGKLLWKYKTGKRIVQSGAVYGNGLVFIGSFDRNIYALDTQNGQAHWIFKTDAVILSSPTYANGLLVAASAKGSIYAINAKTGQISWTAKAGSSVYGRISFHKGFVYVPVQKSIQVYNAANGSMAWNYDLKGKSGLGFAIGESAIYSISSSGYVYSINPASIP